MKTIKQVSELSGASVRALQYYDKINLLSPSRTDSDYRLYGDNDIARLQKILFLKELGFSLKQIRELIDVPDLKKFDFSSTKGSSTCEASSSRENYKCFRTPGEWRHT